MASRFLIDPASKDYNIKFPTGQIRRKEYGCMYSVFVKTKFKIKIVGLDKIT